MRHPIYYAMLTKGGAFLLPTDADLARIRSQNAKVTERIQKALGRDALKWAASLDKKYPKNFTNI